jgi:hypothetical protein
MDGEVIYGDLRKGIEVEINGTSYNFFSNKEGIFAVCELVKGTNLKNQTCRVTIIPRETNPIIRGYS